MTISVYTGTTGSGKSLHAASEIRFQLNRPHPHPVIANFDINSSVVKRYDLFTYRPNEKLTAEWLKRYATDFWQAPDAPPFREDYITLVVDEAQLLYNSRLWTAKDRMSYISFLSQSRKYGYNVILIAQSAKMIDNQFRMLVDFEVNHRKLSSMGLIGDMLHILTFGRLFCRVTTNFQCNEHLGTSFYIGRKRDMALYDSYSTFDPTDTQRRANPEPEPA